MKPLNLLDRWTKNLQSIKFTSFKKRKNCLYLYLWGLLLAAFCGFHRFNFHRQIAWTSSKYNMQTWRDNPWERMFYWWNWFCARNIDFNFVGNIIVDARACDVRWKNSSFTQIPHQSFFHPQLFKGKSNKSYKAFNSLIVYKRRLIFQPLQTSPQTKKHKFDLCIFFVFCFLLPHPRTFIFISFEWNYTSSLTVFSRLLAEV